MPPKKKSGKKGRGKKGRATSKKSSRLQSALPNEDAKLDLSAIEYYNAQIRNLESRIARYQRRCDELETFNRNFLDKFDQLGTDKLDIVAFLKKSVDERLNEIADLNDRIVGLQQAKDVEKEAYEAQLQQLQAEFQETKDQLTSENMILSGKLASLEEFKVQREELMAKFAKLEEARAQKDREHHEEIYQIERKQVIDKDALKKELVVRVNQVASEFRKLSNKQMAETTKRVIRENVAINSQLKKMSEKTSEVLRDNDNDRMNDKDLKMNVDLMEEHDHDVMRKNAANQKFLRKLLDKCKEQEQRLMECERRQQEFGAVKASESGSRTRLEQLMMEIDETRAEIQANEAQVVELDDANSYHDRRLHEQRQMQAQLESTLAESVLAVRDILAMNEVTADYSQVELKLKHDRMLEKLLSILNSSVFAGVGPRLHDFVSTRQSAESYSSNNAMDGFLKPRNAKAAHNKLSQLGFVPVSEMKMPMLLEKVPLLSSTTKYKLNKLDQLTS